MTENNPTDVSTLWCSDEMLRAFAFFSANLHHLLAEIPYERHDELFKQAATYTALADTLDGTPTTMQDDGKERPDQRYDSRPGIFAAFHTGPYRLLGQWLASQGKPLTLVVSADVAAKQGEHFNAWYDKLNTRPGSDTLECLLADDPMIFRKMIRALERGRYLLLYVDGQTGVRRKAGGTGSLMLDFLGGALWVRTGVADLARLARVPIYPLFAYFNAAHVPKVHGLPTLMPPDGGMDRSEWTNHCMSKLYRHLEVAVRQQPAQWEGWMYIHHDLAAAPYPGRGGLLRYYMPFAIKDRCFLLDKARMAAYPISGALYTELRKKCF